MSRTIHPSVNHSKSLNLECERRSTCRGSSLEGISTQEIAILQPQCKLTRTIFIPVSYINASRCVLKLPSLILLVAAPRFCHLQHRLFHQALQRGLLPLLGDLRRKWKSLGEAKPLRVAPFWKEL